ncbi:peptidylprolyl isomerase [Lactovum miscens]|uniref:Peptidyl-prolyl cis-trans isomerase n=1 Tax=Lactovum miscens TaxID=190387 RepID=A0A841C5L6_9LACT|nr:peptidylprolyl isomerase [Lactovum miscens]MBB5888103.1 peptidyl-prolyl cis-trans isomerase A (cyclophilin A) [Lactovum miscens]
MKNKKNIQILTGAIIILLLLSLGAFFVNKKDTAGFTLTSLDGKITKQADLNALSFPQLSTKVAKDEAEIELITTDGNIDIKLFPKLAPMAVKNILTLAKQNYYDNNQFFRVMSGFMIQTGDPSNTGTGSKVISTVNNGKPFATEISNQLYNIRGAVSLANAGTADSSAAQFFINQNNQDATGQLTKYLYPDLIKKAYENGGNPNLDSGYTVFGQVVSGIDVVDKIASGAVTANSQGEKSTPTSPVTIKSVSILKDYNFSK